MTPEDTAPPTSAAESLGTKQLEALMQEVRGGSIVAGGKLYRFVSDAAEPYLRSMEDPEDVEDDLCDVVTHTWDAIRCGAVRRADFLPSFVEILVWQRIRWYLQRTGQPEPPRAIRNGLTLIHGTGATGAPSL